MEKVNTEVLERVANRVTLVSGVGSGCSATECVSIDITISPFSHVEQSHVAQELLALRTLAESMKTALQGCVDRLDATNANWQFEPRAQREAEAVLIKYKEFLA